MKQLKERGMKTVFLLAACTSILAVALICIFLFTNGFSAIGKIGAADFLTGRQWKPLNDIYGIFPMIVGSIYVTAGAMIIGCAPCFWRSSAPRRCTGLSNLRWTCWRGSPRWCMASLP